MSRRCTCRDRRIVRTFQSVFYSDHGPSHVSDHLRYKKRIESRRTISFRKNITLLEKSLQATDSCSPYYTYPLFVRCFQVQTRIFKRLSCSDDTELSIKIHLPNFFLIEIFGRFVIFHLTSKLCAEFWCIETSNRTGAADATFQVLPKSGTLWPKGLIVPRPVITTRFKSIKTILNYFALAST